MYTVVEYVPLKLGFALSVLFKGDVCRLVIGQFLSHELPSVITTEMFQRWICVSNPWSIEDDQSEA